MVLQKKIVQYATEADTKNAHSVVGQVKNKQEKI